MESTTRGAELARTLSFGFTAMVEEVVRELERAGHPGVTATHEFALRAIDDGAQTASELGRRIGVSKQAAAKTIAALEQLGYLARESDPNDARRKHLVVTARGVEMNALGGAAFDRIRARWAAVLGPQRFPAFEQDLFRLARTDAQTLPAGSAND